MVGWVGRGWHLCSLLMEVRIEHCFIQGKGGMKGLISRNDRIID